MEWKTISCAPKYEISESGIIRTKKTGLIRRIKIDKYGYPVISMYRKHKDKIWRTIHRLVCMAFNGCPDNYKDLQVNHLDGNKLNNHHTNLEWCTCKENIIHSYATALNKNKVALTVTDTTTNITTYYRSIKHLASCIGVKSNALIPYIRNSSVYPFLGKYVIWLTDPKEFKKIPNAKRLGKTYILNDRISETTELCISLNQVRYLTGLRGDITDDKLESLGFSLGLSRESVLDKAIVIKNRWHYYSKPYKADSETYLTYDYYTGEVTTFTSLHCIRDYINSVKDIIPVYTGDISNALSVGKKQNRTGLIRGFGIKYNGFEMDWHPYTEEVIITNRLKEFTIPVYKVTRDNVTDLLVGNRQTLKYFGLDPDQIRPNQCKSIIQSFNTSNISVVRLNKPIVQR